MFDFYLLATTHAYFSILIPAFTAFILLLLGNPGAGALKMTGANLGVVALALSQQLPD